MSTATHVLTKPRPQEKIFEQMRDGLVNRLILYRPRIKRTSLVSQMLKRLSIMQETQVQSLGQEDPLEKGMATHSSTIAWKIPWMEEPGRLQSMGLQRVGYD